MFRSVGAGARRRSCRILAQAAAAGSSLKIGLSGPWGEQRAVHTWRKQFRTGELTGFVPVSVVAEPPSLPTPVPVRENHLPVPAPGLVEVEQLPSGVRIRISGEVEVVALRRILSALR